MAGAQRAQRERCATPHHRRESRAAWTSGWPKAEILLSGLMFVAHNAHRDMGAVCEWVLTQDRPGELGPGDVRTALDSLNLSNNAAVSRGAIEVAKGAWCRCGRWRSGTRSSISRAAQTVIWPWTDPGVAASARSPKGQEEPAASPSGSTCRGCCQSEHRLHMLADRGPATVGPGVRRPSERPDQPGRTGTSPRPASPSTRRCSW